MSHFSKDDGQNVKIEVEFRIPNSQYQRNVACSPSIFLLLLASWKALVKHCYVVKASADLFNTLLSKVTICIMFIFLKKDSRHSLYLQNQQVRSVSCVGFKLGYCLG